MQGGESLEVKVIDAVVVVLLDLVVGLLDLLEGGLVLLVVDVEAVADQIAEDVAHVDLVVLEVELAVVDDLAADARAGLHDAADIFLDGVLLEQAVDGDLLELADAVAAVLGLLVHGRVPVGIVEDDVVGGGQVDADAPRARRAHEDEAARVGVEARHQPLPHVHLPYKSTFVCPSSRR